MYKNEIIRRYILKHPGLTSGVLVQKIKEETGQVVSNSSVRQTRRFLKAEGRVPTPSAPTPVTMPEPKVLVGGQQGTPLQEECIRAVAQVEDTLGRVPITTVVVVVGHLQRALGAGLGPTAVKSLLEALSDAAH